MANDDLLGQLGDFLSKGSQSIRDRLTLDVTDLLRAVDKNDPDEVERALRARVDPNATDGIRRRALPIATDNNHLLIVQLLLIAGADPNLTDPYGDTPLFKAVYWENEEIIQALLGADADINQPTANGNSPLQEAQKMGYKEIVDLLQNFHAKKRETQINKDLATHQELKNKAAAARKAREEKAAQLEMEKQQAAAAKEQLQQAEVEQEMAQKYTIEEGNYPKALIEAIRQGDTEGAQFLLEKTSAIDAYVAEYRNTPLFAAIENKNTILTQSLIEKGADTLSLNAEKQHSPLSLAVSLNAYKLVRLILDRNPELSAQSLNNPEHLLSSQFVAYKDAKMLNLLLRGGADPFFGGKHGSAPVVKAIEKGSLGVLPVLVGNEVDLNYRYQGKSLLEWAIEYNRIDWVGALLDEEVDPDQQDENGRTALMYAVEKNFAEAVGLILDEDVDINLRNAAGLNVIQVAEELEDREKILKMLHNY